jgi:hypothetical protein
MIMHAFRRFQRDILLDASQIIFDSIQMSRTEKMNMFSNHILKNLESQHGMKIDDTWLVVHALCCSRICFQY